MRSRTSSQIKLARIFPSGEALGIPLVARFRPNIRLSSQWAKVCASLRLSNRASWIRSKARISLRTRSKSARETRSRSSAIEQSFYSSTTKNRSLCLERTSKRKSVVLRPCVDPKVVELRDGGEITNSAEGGAVTDEKPSLSRGMVAIPEFEEHLEEEETEFPDRDATTKENEAYSGAVDLI